jgi:predicted GNAT superfamily acetyltransferase
MTDPGSFDVDPRTRLTLVGTDADQADQAIQAADAAARAAAVTVREVTELVELQDVVRLFSAIWGRDANPPMTVELLRAFSKAGNYAGGAFDEGRRFGASVWLFPAPAEHAPHSHTAGVEPGLNGRHVGFALKLHQRAWALRRGVSEIAWTFDPLVSRNAYFNIVKLGAHPDEYLPNFYGTMLDSINGDDDSDRLLVRWRLRSPQVVAACRGHHAPAGVTDELAAGATVGLGVSADGEPEPGDLDGATVLVAVPRDIGALRSHDPELAARWRVAVRDALERLIGNGGRIEGFDRSGWYVVRRDR